MIGRIVEKNEYSTKRKERRIRYANTFFDENFGISDFKELNPVLLKRGGTLRYLTKYIAKTGDKMVYSRGVPAEICTIDDICAVKSVLKTAKIKAFCGFTFKVNFFLGMMIFPLIPQFF